MKNRKKANRIILFRKLLVILGILISITTGFIMYSSRATAENSRPVYTYYTSYEIQPGDTLWSIADQFITPETPDKKAFINNIKALNHIENDMITAGNHLVIEYSSYEKL